MLTAFEFPRALDRPGEMNYSSFPALRPSCIVQRALDSLLEAAVWIQSLLLTGLTEILIAPLNLASPSRNKGSHRVL